MQGLVWSVDHCDAELKMILVLKRWTRLHDVVGSRDDVCDLWHMSVCTISRCSCTTWSKRGHLDLTLTHPWPELDTCVAGARARDLVFVL